MIGFASCALMTLICRRASLTMSRNVLPMSPLVSMICQVFARDLLDKGRREAVTFRHPPSL